MSEPQCSLPSYFPSNLYEVLGIPQTAASRDIRQAYRKRALECHPDKLLRDRDNTGDSPSQLSIIAFLPPFSVIHDAAQLLLDPVRRHAYNCRQLLYDVHSKGRCTSDEVDFLLCPRVMGEGLYTSDLCKGLITELSDAALVDGNVAVFPRGITSLTKELEVISSDNVTRHKHTIWSSTPVSDVVNTEVFCILEEEKGESIAGRQCFPQYLWCGYECRCGGLYRIEIPFCAAFSFKSTESSKQSEPLYGLKVVHVECESCSLIISVTNVPVVVNVDSASGRGQRKEVFSSSSDEIERRYRDLFPPLL